MPNLFQSQSTRRAAGAQSECAERGDIIAGWLLKLVIVLSVIGIAAVDGISILSTRTGVVDDANYSARAAADYWNESKDIRRAYEVAVAAATEQHADNKVDPKSFAINADGTVQLRVRRTAKTFFVHRLDRTAGWARIDEEATGAPLK